MKPCIVVVGLDQTLLDEIVQGLIGENKHSDANNSNNDLLDWTIDTKYYTADVHLCTVNNKKLVDESVANSAQVLMLLMDPSQINSRTKLDSWLPFLSVLDECENKILIARSANALSSTIPRDDLNQWCTEHEFELLELEKCTTSETDDEEEDDDDDENSHLYRDVYGIARLIQTLHLHQWPNMNMKDRREINRDLSRQLQAKLKLFEGGDLPEEKEEGEQQQHQQQFDSLTASNHHDVDDFGMENMFDQIRRFKEKADHMTDDERKRLAEEVVMSLWKTVGNDDDDEGEDDEEQ